MGNELVECYSGHEYAERPLAFQWEGNRLEVDQVEAGWQIPDGKCFLVRVRDGRHFELVYNEELDRWQVHMV